MNTPSPVSFIFFGASDDSVAVLQRLTNAGHQAKALVTHMPKKRVKSGISTKSPVHAFGEDHDIHVAHFSIDPKAPWKFLDPNAVEDMVASVNPDILISASFGMLIPWGAIDHTGFGGINVHPSLLPLLRGADPVPWTILQGERQTGVSVAALSRTFDKGDILASKKIPLSFTETRTALRRILFELGAELLVMLLAEFGKSTMRGKTQQTNHASFARKLRREDGFIPWQILDMAQKGKVLSDIDTSHSEPMHAWLQTDIGRALQMNTRSDTPIAMLIDRMYRALEPWPGVWTVVDVNNQSKRLKILAISTQNNALSIRTVQLEGKKPVPYAQFFKAYGLG